MKTVKSLALAFAFAFVAFAANAQISAGTMFIGGEALFSSSSIEPNGGDKGTVTSGIFGPKFGYFVGDNIAVGVQLGFGGTTADENSTFSGVEEKETIFQAGVFGRYYNMFNDNFGLFGEAEVNYATTKFESDGTEYQNDNGINGGIGLGFVFFPSNRFAFEGTLGLVGFESITSEDADGNELGTTSDFVIGAGSFDIGFTAAWYFNR